MWANAHLSLFPSAAFRGGTLQDAVMRHIEVYDQMTYMTISVGGLLVFFKLPVNWVYVQEDWGRYWLLKPVSAEYFNVQCVKQQLWSNFSKFLLYKWPCHPTISQCLTFITCISSAAYTVFSSGKLGFLKKLPTVQWITISLWMAMTHDVASAHFWTLFISCCGTLYTKMVF